MSCTSIIAQIFITLNAKYTTYLIITLEISNQLWDSYMSTHSLSYFFLILKIYQKHIHHYGNLFFFQLPRSLPKFLTRLPFFLVLVLTILLVPGSDSYFILNL